nr:MAG: CRISPR-associated RAMP protein [Leptolyngbya sp. IPPAS B-1204]
MFDTFKNRLKLEGVLTTVTALRISQGRSTEPIGSDLPVVKDALGKPLIPGSSFKGAMRSQLESFLRGIDPNLAANPAIEAEWAVPYQSVLDEQGNTIKTGLTQLKEQAETIFKNVSGKESKKDKWLTDELLQRTDLVSILFGSPWIASKFQVRDLTVLPDFWFGQYQERDGVAIDRDTETAADGKLYDFQVVPAGTPFQFRAIVENAEDWELGLLMIGLHQFETEQIPLGGGRSRGLGIVCLEVDDVWWFDYPEDQPEELLTYLQRLTQGDTTLYQLSQEQFQAHRHNWTEALITYLRDTIVAPTGSQVASREA